MDTKRDTLGMLQRLKSQESRPNPLAMERNPFGSEKNPVKENNLNKEVARYERLLKKVEEIENKVKSGNYLIYYQEMNEKQKHFLEETEKLDSDLEMISPILYRKILGKREQLKNRKF